jgi:Fe-S-cluster containining protein
VTATPPIEQPDDPNPRPWGIWVQAARQPDLIHQLSDLYSSVDAEIDRRGPVCWASGRCCNFHAYGHRLYVTALEIAYVMHQYQTRSTPQRPGQPDPLTVLTDPDQISPLKPPGTCPFQIQMLCSIRDIRPLGCRIFFCQKGTQAWQQDLYEKYLTDIKSLHDRWFLPYLYMDWMVGLCEWIKH